MLKLHLLYSCLGGILVFTILVQAQSQSGFISIDCGIQENSSYTDQTTGLNYVSDSAFIDNHVGVSKPISLDNNSNTLEQQFWYVKSFPSGDKNCYTLKPAQGKGTKYLIRARFMYGNFDGENAVPGSFDLYIGANKWGSVKLDNESSVTTMEIIHLPPSNYVFVCLVNTGHGTPFISALELRPLKNSTYPSARASVLYRRLDIGSQSNKPIRYKDDAYDRIWQPFNFAERLVLNTSLTINSGNSYQAPSSVLSTAMEESENASTFSFHMIPGNPVAQYYVYMHFAEVEKLEAGQSREFNIYENGELWNGPFSPDYLAVTTVFSLEPVSGERIDYQLNRTETSTHPPILNALEVYIIQDFSESQTDEQDVDAIMNINSMYGVKKNWQGDPCAPKIYMWDGVNCSFNDQDPAKIISLNLSSSGLTGEIASYISDLTKIELLLLRGNNLSGSVPVDLIEKSKNGSLLLSVAENPNLCSSPSCQKKKKHNYIIPVIASVATLLALLVAFLIGWRLIKRKKQGLCLVFHKNQSYNNDVVVEGDANKPKFMREIGSALEQKNHQFTYSEVMIMTNNLEKVIGQGGFGTVYHGYLNDTQVAVKMLSESSAQGYKEFQAEVKLLMRVHHRNLTSLVGHCNEENHLGLVYEYMANGNLGRHLSEKNAHTLSWEDRLRIAVDAAQGLEYLHHGCRPPIVHRDVKTANILLNEKFQAKLADFGLSRAFPIEGGSHVSTVVAGTPGQLDPECFSSAWLNEKSDVYSFGVVLLEIFTSRPVLVKSDIEHTHISQWVTFMLEEGDIRNIVDPRLRGEFQISSAWKAVEIAMSCVRHNSLERPMMNQVVTELNECLTLEVDSKKDGRQTRHHSSRRMTLNFDIGLNPLPR